MQEIHQRIPMGNHQHHQPMTGKSRRFIIEKGKNFLGCNLMSGARSGIIMKVKRNWGIDMNFSQKQV